jgi:hypothetical protein
MRLLAASPSRQEISSPRRSRSRAGLRIPNNSPEKLLRRLAQEPGPARDEFESGIEHLREWAEEAIVRDARGRRNTAVHRAEKQRVISYPETQAERDADRNIQHVHDQCRSIREELARRRG